MTGLRVGDRVRHWKFGDGTVTLPEESDRVTVDFDSCGRTILNVTIARMTPVRMAPVERHPLTVEGRAARLASHLRRLAVMLRERGSDAPPLPAQMHLGILRTTSFSYTFRRRIFFSWLHLILTRRPDMVVDNTRYSLRNALDFLEYYECDISEYPGAGLAAHEPAPKILLPRRRISHYASRWNVMDVDSVVVALAWRYQWNFAIYEAALYWTALTHDLRFMLTVERAERIEMLASVLERAAGLPRSPPRWGTSRGGGRWRHVAYDLVMKLDVSADYLNERARAAGTPVTIDFLAVRIEPEALAEPRSLNLVEQCRKMLLRACEKKQQQLRIARIELQPQANAPTRYAVYLETWERGNCVEGVLERCGALKYAWLKAD